jgi:hypothetical protein
MRKVLFSFLTVHRPKENTEVFYCSQHKSKIYGSALNSMLHLGKSKFLSIAFVFQNWKFIIPFQFVKEKMNKKHEILVSIL